jgi:alpha-glucosidase
MRSATGPALWWQRGIVYQIYPCSFQDSNGDGIGDLEGIRRRLDYIWWLGVDAIWISPIYPSPMTDFGYDISEYCDIDPVFGTLADFDRLVAEVHARGLKIILDFVPNHTSDRHPWFLESRSSRSSPKRDWYIWRDPAPDGGPPNNWLANFGGSAWELDVASGQYFYHAFLKEQPDLNWRNPEVRTAMFDVLRFWLNRGVDGFRVDVIWHLIKDDQFRDNPSNPAWRPDKDGIDRLLQVYSADRPEVHEIVAEMRQVLDDYPDRVLIGEIYLPLERLVTYYGQDMKGAHLPFNFQLIFAPWTAASIAQIVAEYESALPQQGWPNWVLGNHDQKRIATRVGQRAARIAAMLLLILRGTPTLYYGDEIGLEDVPIAPECAQDPWERNELGLGLGRDPARTPMPWDGTADAGFSTGTPWLPLNPDHVVRNVASQRRDPDSMLALYRQLIWLRRSRPVLQTGRYSNASPEGDVFVFERQLAAERLIIMLNFSPHERAVRISPEWRVLLSTALDRAGEVSEGTPTLRGWEGVILEGAEAALQTSSSETEITYRT